MRTKKRYTVIMVLLLGFAANAQTLQDYLEIAKVNSSEIKEQSLKHKLTQEKINEVGNIEDTNIGVGYFVSTPETRVGAQIVKIGMQQELPWFGTLKTEKEVVKSISEVKQFDIELSERELLFKVKSLYYQLYQKYRITDILKDNKQILTTYENMALAALENNKATMSDVLNIKIQKNELHSKIFRNINEINALTRNFNRLLQQDVETLLHIEDSLNVMDIILNKASVEAHPSLSKIDKEQEVFKNEDALIEKQRAPQLAFGLDYILVEERQDLKLNDNGKDIVMPNLSLSIPIFTKKYKSKSQQIKIEQEALMSKRQSQQKQLEIALEESVLALDNSILSVVAAQKNTAETQLAINVDLKAYETGILNYDRILKLQLQKIKFQLMEVEGVKEAFISKAKLEYLTQ